MNCSFTKSPSAANRRGMQNLASATHLHWLGAMAICVLVFMAFSQSVAAGTKEVDIVNGPVPVQETRAAYFFSSAVVIPTDDYFATIPVVEVVPADRVLVIDTIAVDASFATTYTNHQVWVSVTPNVTGEQIVRHTTPPKNVTMELDPPGGSFIFLPVIATSLGINLPPGSSFLVTLYQNAKFAFDLNYRVAITGHYLATE